MDNSENIQDIQSRPPRRNQKRKRSPKIKNTAQIQLNMNDETKEESYIPTNKTITMDKKKSLYRYFAVLAVCIGILVGLLTIGLNYITGQSACARAVISFQYKGIEDGVDPNGAAFDINKLKSRKVVEDALTASGAACDVTQICESIEIDGIIPADAIERIMFTAEMQLDNVSNQEKISDVSYYPSQYVVCLHKNPQMSGAQTEQLLNAILESYRNDFIDTYANTKVLTITENLIHYQNYDYADAMDVLETQISIMQNYVNAYRNQAPEFRSTNTGLSFGDISAALHTVSSTDIANLNAYIETHTLTKDLQQWRESCKYKIKHYNMMIEQNQLQLSNLLSVINKYQKDPVLIVSSQETTQELEQSNPFFDRLLAQRLELSANIASLNTKIDKLNTLLDAASNINRKNTQQEYDYADEKLSVLSDTIVKWADLTEQTVKEYYTTTLFSNAYKISAPAHYTAFGGIKSSAVKILVPVAALLFVVFTVRCADGLFCEFKKSKENKK